jgi:signal transduction histidine kinase
VLYEFLIANRGEILSRSRAVLTARDAPPPTDLELAHGLPLFFDEVTAIFGHQKADRAVGHRDIVETARLHGGELLRMGLTVGQVVQDYGSICQSVTELADELDVAITADEFHTFNRCLDDAVAQAVTSYEQQRDLQTRGSTTEELGSMVHQMRNMVTTSMLTFDALKRGTIGIHGSTGSLLGSSLKRMRVLLDRTLAEVQFGAGACVRERMSLVELVEEIASAARREATELDVQLSIDGGSSDVAVEVDRQVLVSALANLVQNALKFTRPRGVVTVRAHTVDEHALIDVRDECGGLPLGKAEDLFRPIAERSAGKRDLGMGFSISLKGVRASGGEIRVLDQPGVGCVFTIDLPRAPLTPATK